MLTPMHWLAKYLELQAYSTNLKRFDHNYSLETIYKSLILCKLNYGILAWGHDNNRVSNAHSEPLLKKLNLMKVENLNAATIKMSC